MAKLTESYETIMVLSPKLGEEKTKELVEKFKSLISENGTIDSEEEWGSRRLAYPINDENEGYYYLINFTSAPSLPAELDRRYKINDGVMRSLIVAKVEDTRKPRHKKADVIKADVFPAPPRPAAAPAAPVAPVAPAAEPVKAETVAAPAAEPVKSEQ